MTEKLLVVCRNFWPEKNRINDLCLRLGALGFQIDVLCGQPSGEDGAFYPGYNSYRVQRETHRKMNLYRTLDVKKGSWSNVRIFLNYTVFPITSFFQLKKICKNDYDAVLIYQVSPVMMCGPGNRIGKRLGIPVYTFVADLWPQRLYGEIDVQSSAFKALLTRFSMRYYKKASKVIATTLPMRNFLSARLGIAAQDVPVVSVSPDLTYRARIKEQSLMEKLAGSFTVLFVGDFEEQLSVPSMLHIAELLKGSDAWNIRFLLVGDTPLIRKLKHEAGERNLNDYFFFEGDVSDDALGKYLEIADVLAAVVRPEKTNEYMIPEQVIDYLCAAKPLLLTLSANVRDLIKDAACGYTSDPGDDKAFFQNLMRIYRMSPSDRLRLGENAGRYQQLYFDPEENAQKIAAILNGDALPFDVSPEESSIRRLWE